MTRAASRAMIAGAMALGLGPTWSGVDALIRERFPGVPTLTTTELTAWLADPERPRPLLLDVRGANEFSVSHLPGARHLSPDADPAVSLAGVDRATPIVAYCAVGYRSARTVARLRTAGFSDVHNLAGSIFRWAEEGRPLVRDGRTVAVVHPYDAYWGRLLRPELRSVR